MSELVCKHCGNDELFYTKERYKGRCDVYFRTDNQEVDNGHVYEYAEHSYRSKFVYCGECGKKVCKIEELD